MMRKCLPALALVVLAAPALAAGPKPAADWKEDPVCRMVFFAVLEGLHADGVSAEAVASVVGGKGGDVKRTFVFECPLCHPVYEAFRAYGRAADVGLGKGLEKRVEEGLRSDNLLTRQRALRAVTRGWIDRRLASMRLSEKEQADWTRRLAERSAEGKAKLAALRKDDPLYKLWSIYAGCAACDGVTDACRDLKAAGGR